MNKGVFQSNDLKESSTILQRIAQGDEYAVSECLERYGDVVWRIARKLSRTKQDAQDAAQEIFIDIWKNAARFDAAKSPEGAFIVLLARRRMIDRLRSLNCRLQTTSFESVSKSDLSNTNKKLEMYLQIKPIVEELNKLKHYKKQVIVMSVFDGMSHREISKKVGLPLGTVKTNIRRGFQEIRDSINQQTLHQQTIITNQ